MDKKNRKKTKRQLEKEYVPIRGLLGDAQDYHVYSMRLIDRLTGFGIGFGISFLIMFVFFRVLWFCLAVGVITGLAVQNTYRRYRIKKRREQLLIQFKDMLENLSASYSAGDNTLDAFIHCFQDLTNMYGEEADIVKETGIIVNGLSNGLIVEDLLMNFAERSGLEDVQSFADVFTVANRQGGNIKKIVSDTRTVINEKIEMEMEIQSMLNAGKNEINIMICMPIVIVLVLGTDSSMSITTNSFVNVVVKVVCLGIFAAAYMLGKKITNIKV